MEAKIKIEQDFFCDEEMQEEKKFKKSTKAISKVRRLLEDRAEIKRLNELCGSDYWEDIA